MAKRLIFLLLLAALVGRGHGRLSRGGLPSSPPPPSGIPKWPCPSPSAIFPCICTTDADYNLDMDCSDVVSDSQLQDVFQASFPYRDFRRLTIHPTVPSPSLQTLWSGTFGDATFQHVAITGTRLRKVEEGAFAGSRETLLTLDLGGNLLDDFPSGTLPQYLFLWYLNLATNYLPELPDLASDSLRVLHLEENLGLSVADTTFGHVRLLELLYLQDMRLGGVPPNAFAELSVLRVLNLDGNDLSGVLGQDALKVPLGSLEVLLLRRNGMTGIHPTSITGLSRDATVDFRSNDITLLNEANWWNLLQQVAHDNAIDLRDNNLACGCEVFWLVLDYSLMRKIHEETRCGSNGPRLHDLPLSFFLDNC